MLKKKGGGQIMSENINHIQTDKNCKKQGKTPKYVGEHLSCDKQINNVKKEGRWLNYVGEQQTHQHRQKM